MESTEQEEKIIVRERPLVDGKTLVIGGGIVALIAFLFFRGKGGGGKDARPLLLRLRSDGMWLGDTQYGSVLEVMTRIRGGGRNDVTLQASGDISQGQVDDLVSALKGAGFVVYQRQSVGSIYQRGLGRIA